MIYRGYLPEGAEIDHVKNACEWYRNKTGYEPTVIIVRGEAPKIYDASPLVVRSPSAMAYGMMITHLQSPNEINSIYQPPKEEENPIDKDDEMQDDETDDDSDTDDTNKQKGVNGRRKSHNEIQKSGGTCPHCKGLIKDYDRLGWWYGWDRGKFPPYWDRLRNYVFKRDDYTCQRCRQRFAKELLVAHHIKPKEAGGEDSARNLLTMCKDCHPDDKPIYSEEEVTYASPPP